MEIEQAKESYKKCINLLHKKRKTIPYKDLDICLYIVEKYIRWMEED